MRLYEFEGKRLFAAAGIPIPNAKICSQTTCSFLTSSGEQSKPLQLHFPLYIKVQTLSGNRAALGGIVKIEEKDQETGVYEKTVAQFLDQGFHDEKVEYVLAEEAVANITKEHYLAIRWDTAVRGVVVLYSETGGSGIEERSKTSAQMQRFVIDMMDPVGSLTKIAKQIHPHVREVLLAMGRVFYDNDATLVEINPLFELKDRTWVAGDAKVELDDVAEFRHPEWANYPKRSLFARPPTPMEEEAKRINAMDHRGVAGASFFEFDGEIGIMASGGGASLLAMDALMASGLKPANYTEYSGNPPREKVAALTKLVLSKKGLKGLWVIGGNANFTDIYETLTGLMDGIEATQPKVDYPIVIRRGGPRWQEAFEMVKERAIKGGFDITLFGPDYPMISTVTTLVEKVKK